MPGLPGVNIKVRDGGLGLTPSGAGGLFAKIGPSPLGVVNGVYSAADQNTVQAILGNGGPLSESAALALSIGGQGSVRPSGLLLVPVNPSTYGTVSAVTRTGTGVAAPTIAIKPAVAFHIKCVLAGAAGVSQWQTSLDGGVTWGATWTSAATLIIPGAPFTTLAFGAGTAVLGDIVQVPASATAPSLYSGSGTLIPTVQGACPVDAYSVIVTITTGGVLGVAMFTFSLDGGITTSAPVLMPASGIYPFPDGLDPNAGQTVLKPAGTICTTGIVATFAAGTYVLGDTYSFTTTSASYTGSDLTAAYNALAADTRFGSGVGVHVVGAAASVAASATLLATLDVLLIASATSFKFNGAFIEVPTDTDANTLAAFAAASSLRIMACAGTEKQVSPLNGRNLVRSAAWQIAARAGCIGPSEALGRVDSGSLPGVISLVRDEAITPGLDAGRFGTLTSIIGRNGFYITGPGRMMAPNGSDFTFWPYRRVMDYASFYGRLAFLKFLNDTVRVNADGTIAERDAKAIEAYADFIIRNGLAGHMSDLFVSVNRTNNVISTQTILPTVRVLPVGYAVYINVDLGFTNQALAVKAA